MVGPPRGPPRPPMAPQPRAGPALPTPPQQPQQQIILKQVMPYTMVTKPSTQNIVNYLQLPVMPGNGSFLAVSSKPPETNGTTFLTMSPRPSYLVTTANNNNNNSANTNNNNNSTTYIAMESPPPPASASAHQYLIPKPEPFAMHNYSKNEPSPMLAPLSAVKRRIPVVTRPTNHQRIKEEEEDEGEEVRPVLDPDRPLADQLVQMDHSYPHWLPPRLPPIDDEDKESTISSDEKPEVGDEGEETETAAEGEDSVTRCICNLEHDDGYMISCDECYVWQHVACVLPDLPVANSLPDMTYLCDLCQPRDLDRNRARALQLQRRKQILHRQRDSSEDSWSSADRTGPPPKKVVARRRAEPVPRRPSKVKREPPDGPVRSRPRLDSLDGPVRTKKLDSPLDSPNRVKLLKPLSRGRRDSVKVPPPPPQHVHSPTAVGRRTKFKRKLESKTYCRRMTKRKDPVEIKTEKEEEKPKVLEQRSSRSAGDRTPAKSRCRLSHTAIGEPILIVTCRVLSGEPLTELRGKYLQTTSSTTPRPEVLYHYRFPKDGTEVTMDGSGRENLVRYARRSCYPNSQLKHYLLKGSLRLYLVATETLEKNQQITIPHGCVTESITAGDEETCGKDCTYGHKFIPEHATERRRRSRRRTVSAESEERSVSPLKRGETGRPPSPLSPTSDKERKMTREEKKIEQAMKIFAQMEKDTARKRDKERPERTLSGNFRRGDSDKESPVEGKQRRRRRRRRRRSSRKSRLPSGSGAALSHASGDDSDVSTGDDLPSPDGKHYSKDSSKEDEEDKEAAMNDAAGMLLALGGARNNITSGRHTPINARENSENDSSPGTPIRSACLLVTAAVGPLAPGFKFPKTKKGMVNEWLGRSPEHGDVSPLPDSTPSDANLPPGAPKLANLSNRLYYPVREPLNASAGFGKKRWLRQAISEETEAPQGSPLCPPDNVTPLKKRRLARESMTSEPPTTPTHDKTPSPAGDDNPNEDLIERVRGLQPDFEAAIEYDTSPQRVPENLTTIRADAEEAPTSPQVNDTRPRRGRKRPAQTRPSPRAKRKTRKTQLVDSEEDLKSPVLTAIKDEPVERWEDASGGPPPVLVPEPVCKVEPREELNNGCEPKALYGAAEERVEPPAGIAEIGKSVEKRELVAEEEKGSEMPVLIDVKSEILAEEVKKLEVPVTEQKNLEMAPVLQVEIQKECSVIVETPKTRFPASFEEPASVNHGESEVTGVAVVDRARDGAVIDATVVDGASATTLVKDNLKVNGPSVNVDPAKPELAVDLDDNEKCTPAKRKLSITEYLKRKGAPGKKASAVVGGLPRIPESKSRPPSPPSDDDISPLLLPTPTLPFPLLDGSAKGGRFKVEPTELERQRENLNERLRREFGLMINDDEPKPSPTTPPETTNGFPDSKISFSESKLSFPETKLALTGSKLSFSEPKLGLVESKLGLTDSKLSFPELKLGMAESKFGLTESKLGHAESKLGYPVAQHLPQSAIYPVGSSNPPNPHAPSFPTSDRFNFRN